MVLGAYIQTIQMLISADAARFPDQPARSLQRVAVNHDRQFSSTHTGVIPCFTDLLTCKASLKIRSRIFKATLKYALLRTPIQVAVSYRSACASIIDPGQFSSHASLLPATDFPSAAHSNDCCRAAIAHRQQNNIVHSSTYLQPGSATVRFATIAPATHPASSPVA
ncbi:hypothetical protein EV677_2551 [Herminiimonas fonticola]|uniref:Uncharacterized protein n=1 Tax=Herminiimonas fonticola TaxID=303380 RepID=A0A4R6G5J1_9BURK|nr:hypothetical protein Hfont_2588 [Herminiimonas fonticola]TDN88964.1 hypothetical protein EV677_2551 [Herminiimonas fonticola]